MTDNPSTPGTTPWGVQLPDPATEAGASTPALLFPIFRSEAQARILAELYAEADPKREHSLHSLCLWTNVLPDTVYREVAELVEAGLLFLREDWPMRYVRVVQHEGLDALAEVITTSYGVKPLLERGLYGMPGVERALLHGPWAIRYSGIRGSRAHEVDLLVVGRPDPSDVYRLVDEVERKSRTLISPVILTPEVWDAAAEPFTQTIKSSPHVRLLVLGLPSEPDDADEGGDHS